MKHLFWLKLYICARMLLIIESRVCISEPKARYTTTLVKNSFQTELLQNSRVSSRVPKIDLELMKNCSGIQCMLFYSLFHKENHNYMYVHQTIEKYTQYWRNINLNMKNEMTKTKKHVAMQIYIRRYLSFLFSKWN